MAQPPEQANKQSNEQPDHANQNPHGKVWPKVLHCGCPQALQSGAHLGDLRRLLDRAIIDGAKRALEAAIRHIASVQHLVRGADFPATLVSLTAITVVPSLLDSSISMFVHGGTISGITEDAARD